MAHSVFVLIALVLSLSVIAEVHSQDVIVCPGTDVCLPVTVEPDPPLRLYFPLVLTEGSVFCACARL